MSQFMQKNLTFEYTKMTLSIHKKLSMLKRNFQEADGLGIRNEFVNVQGNKKWQQSKYSTYKALFEDSTGQNEKA